VDNFFTFHNIELNPKKYKTFRISKNKSEGIQIGGEIKEFIQDTDFIEYLGTPLRLIRIAKKKFFEAKMQKLFDE
jgi:hypothetical protein